MYRRKIDSFEFKQYYAFCDVFKVKCVRGKKILCCCGFDFCHIEFAITKFDRLLFFFPADDVIVEDYSDAFCPFSASHAMS